MEELGDGEHLIAEQAQPASTDILNAAETWTGVRLLEPLLRQRRRPHLINLARPIAPMPPPVPIGSGRSLGRPRHGPSLPRLFRPAVTLQMG